MKQVTITITDNKGFVISYFKKQEEDVLLPSEEQRRRFRPILNRGPQEVFFSAGTVEELLEMIRYHILELLNE